MVTIYESLIVCPLCQAQLVIPHKDHATNGSTYIPKHMYGGQSSFTGQDGWVCNKQGTNIWPVASRQYEVPD